MVIPVLISGFPLFYRYVNILLMCLVYFIFILFFHYLFVILFFISNFIQFYPFSLTTKETNNISSTLNQFNTWIYNDFNTAHIKRKKIHVQWHSVHIISNREKKCRELLSGGAILPLTFGFYRLPIFIQKHCRC